jgi:APA family basic amino acid/polyamine antiporter
MGGETVAALGGTTALLLLCVFTIVNIAVLVLRRTPVDRDHFRAPRFLPYLGVLTCAYLVGPWAQDPVEYQIAGFLIGLGVLLWALTWIWNRAVRAKQTRIRHPEDLGG